jgi:hypothetical protein
MRYRPLILSIVAILSIGQTQAPATDLAKIDRSIAKEPAYKTKPKYCLLVFGAEAKHRVWLVVDGDTLYVDRNGNGDLTEATSKIAAEKSEGRGLDEITFKVPELRIGDRVHKDIKLWMPKLDYMDHIDKRVKDIVAKNPKARAFHVSMEIERPGWKGSGIGGRVQQASFIVDVNGVLQFGDRPQDAPILHFDGALEVTLFGLLELKIGRETQVTLGVGSPGYGPGTHTYLEYDGVIPAKMHPTIEVVYAGKKPSDPPIRVKHELKDRC